MRKYALMLIGLVALGACDKHDPILPGTRTAIFDNGTSLNILNTNIENLPDTLPTANTNDCKYTVDNTNIIRDGDRKIFIGYPASNSMDIEIKPLCDGGYLYSGLHTGNVVKVAPKTRRISWMADVYSESNMIGGAATVDVVAPLVMDGDYIYAAGMGDAFCKINKETGHKKWCTSVGTRYPFIILKNVAYIVGLDKYLYAVRLTDGAIYWRTELTKVDEPKYADKIITIHKQKFDAANGNKI